MKYYPPTDEELVTLDQIIIIAPAYWNPSQYDDVHLSSDKLMKIIPTTPIDATDGKFLKPTVLNNKIRRSHGQINLIFLMMIASTPCLDSIILSLIMMTEAGITTFTAMKNISVFIILTMSNQFPFFNPTLMTVAVVMVIPVSTVS